MKTINKIVLAAVVCGLTFTACQEDKLQQEAPVAEPKAIDQVIDETAALEEAEAFMKLSAKEAGTAVGDLSNARRARFTRILFTSSATQWFGHQRSDCGQWHGHS